MAMGACTSGGTANASPSTAATNAPRSAYGVAPWLAARSAAASGLRPHTATSSMPSVEASAAACVSRAQ